MRPYFEDDALRLYHGDMREAGAFIADGSVRLVFTDPPYDRKSIDLYEDAARLAARVLEPRGAFVCYAGQYALADIIAACSAHLRYWWTLCLWQPGSSARLPGLNVGVMWKPMLLFVKGTRGWDAMLPDGYISPAPDKRHHVWGQSIGPAREVVSRLTAPGELVVDPFAGGGTTLRAAKDLGRRAIGIERDGAHCERMVQRFAQLVLPLAV